MSSLSQFMLTEFDTLAKHSFVGIKLFNRMNEKKRSFDTINIDKNLGLDHGITMQSLAKLRNSRYHYSSEFYEAIPTNTFFQMYGTDFTMVTAEHIERSALESTKNTFKQVQTDPLIKEIDDLHQDLIKPLPALFYDEISESCEKNSQITKEEVIELSSSTAYETITSSIHCIQDHSL